MSSVARLLDAERMVVNLPVVVFTLSTLLLIVLRDIKSDLLGMATLSGSPPRKAVVILLKFD